MSNKKANLQYEIEPDTLLPDVAIAHFNPAQGGLNIKWRTIPDFEFVYIIQNPGSIDVLDMEYSFDKGDIIFTPPWIRHRYRTDSPPSPHLAIHFTIFPGFEEQFRNNALIKTGGKSLKVILAGQRTIPFVIRHFPPARKYLFDEVVKLKAEADIKHSPTAKLRLRQAMIDLLCELFDFILETGRYERKILSESINYIDHCFHRNITILELANIENLTPNYYSTLFRKHYGITPIDYITRKRLGQAKKLMHESNMKISDIATACGFEDPYYFSRVFKRYEMKSPGKYRQLII